MMRGAKNEKKKEYFRVDLSVAAYNWHDSFVNKTFYSVCGHFKHVYDRSVAVALLIPQSFYKQSEGQK